MIVTPANVKLALPPPIAPRSKGVHVSGIIRGIATEMGILNKEQAGEVGLADVRSITDPTAILRISIGLAWEEWYIPHILAAEGVAKHPGETQVDGVYMTPDGESLDVIITHWPKLGIEKRESVIRIHEIKATYKSTNTVGDISKEWMWLTQMKAYCVGSQTRFAKLHVLFLCGDYKFPISPQLKCWNIEFTDKEIEETWSLLTDYRNARSKGR